MGGTLNDRVAVVTGAGRGVGRAYAIALATEGAAVVVNDLPARDGGRSDAEAVVNEIVEAGGRAVAAHGSVADFDATGEIMETAVGRFGTLDILVANAGNTKPVSLLESSASDWADVVAVHLNGTFNSIHHAANHIVRAGGGSVITTGDIQTDLIFPGLGAYRSAKGGIAVLTLQAAWELEKHHINVNSIMPGLTTSVMSDVYMGSLGDERSSFAKRARVRYGAEEARPVTGPAAPETVPPLGVYLCTDAARGITGRLFQMAGGTTIRLVAPCNATFGLTPDGAAWTMDELAAKLPGLVDTAPVTSPS